MAARVGSCCFAGAEVISASGTHGLAGKDVTTSGTHGLAGEAVTTPGTHGLAGEVATISGTHGLAGEFVTTSGSHIGGWVVGLSSLGGSEFLAGRLEGGCVVFAADGGVLFDGSPAAA